MSQDTSASAESTLTLLNAHALNCQRGENVLFNGLDFSVETSQCVHVIGQNGSGKTSLLRILCGINAPEDGEVCWRGTPLPQSEDFYKDMTFIGHKDALKNELTAFENLRFFQELDGPFDEDKLDDSLTKLKILHCADITAQGLSFGQRRRLTFSRLLLARKRLWILDEPFTGVDTEGRELMQRHCVEHLESGGAIILTHHQSLRDQPLGRYRSEFDLTRFKPANQPREAAGDTT